MLVGAGGANPELPSRRWLCLCPISSVTSHSTYNLMLRILGHKGFIKDFWAFLNSMGDAGHTINRGTYVTLLANFKKHKMAAESSAWTQFYSRTMARAASDAAIDSAVKLVLASQEWNEAAEKKLQDLNLSLSEIVVAKVLREVRGCPSKALAFFRWAGKRPGYKHGSVAYNAMARVLGREDCIGEFWSLLQEMKGEGHDMDIDTYKKLSRQFQKTKMVREAVELYELMMDGPYNPEQRAPQRRKSGRRRELAAETSFGSWLSIQATSSSSSVSDLSTGGVISFFFSRQRWRRRKKGW